MGVRTPSPPARLPLGEGRKIYFPRHFRSFWVIFRCRQVTGEGRGRLGQARGVFQVLDVGIEFLHFAEVDDEREGVTGGAKTEGRIGRLHGIGKDGGAQRHQTEEFLTGEVGSLLADAVDVLAEGGISEPAAQGGLIDAGGSGSLGYGRGRGNNGESGLLAKGEVGKISFPASFAYRRPFSDRNCLAGRVLFLIGTGNGTGTLGVAELRGTGFPGFSGHMTSRCLSGRLDLARVLEGNVGAM